MHLRPVLWGQEQGLLCSQAEPEARGGPQGLFLRQDRAPSLQAQGRTQTALAAAMRAMPTPTARQPKNSPLGLGRWNRRARALLLQAPCQPSAWCEGVWGQQVYAALCDCPDPFLPCSYCLGSRQLHQCCSRPALLRWELWHSMTWGGTAWHGVVWQQPVPSAWKPAGFVILWLKLGSPQWCILHGRAVRPQWAPETLGAADTTSRARGCAGMSRLSLSCLPLGKACPWVVGLGKGGSP